MKQRIYGISGAFVLLTVAGCSAIPPKTVITNEVATENSPATTSKVNTNVADATTNVVVANANTANTNSTNIEVVTNTNETVTNESTNTGWGSDVSTDGWQVYTNNEIGIQFEYPVSKSIEFHLTDCTTGKCDSTTGESYYLNTVNQNGDLYLTFAGAATPDFQADRDLGFFDVVFFRNSNSDFEAVLSGNNGFVIHPTKQASYKSGKVVIYEIKDLPSYPQLLDVIPERKDDKVAIYNFNKTVNGFKSISIILTPEMSEQDIDRILNSIVIM